MGKEARIIFVVHTSGGKEKHVVCIFCASWISSSREPVEDAWKAEQVRFSPTESHQTERLCLGVSFLSLSLFEHVVELMNGRQELGLEVGE